MLRWQAHNLAFVLAAFLTFAASGALMAQAIPAEVDATLEPMVVEECHHPMGRRLKPLENGVLALNRAFVSCVGGGKKSECQQCAASEEAPSVKPLETLPVPPPERKRPTRNELTTIETSNPSTAFSGYSETALAPRPLLWEADDVSENTTIIAALADLKTGRSPADVARDRDVPERVVRGWQRRYHDLPPAAIEKLHSLEEENHRLKRLLAERDLEIDRLRQDR